MNDNIINLDFLKDRLFQFVIENKKETHPWNTALRENLTLDKDYHIFNSEIWEFFKKLYPEAIEIRRFAHFNNTEKKVEVNLKKINVVLYDWAHLKLMENTTKIEYYGKIQVSHYMKMTTFYGLLLQTFSDKSFERIFSKGFDSN